MSSASSIRITGIHLSPGHIYFGRQDHPPGVAAALHGRGGLRARILTDGKLRVDA